jgi:hypothetical protein
MNVKGQKLDKHLVLPLFIFIEKEVRREDMPIVEKNDVDISPIFLWNKEITIKGLKEESVVAYMRLLGDADINRARIMALRKSADLRNKLRDEESDERLALIPSIAELSHEVIVESIIVYTMRDLTQVAVKNAVIPKPKEPGSDASTERLEKFQKEVDEYPDLREKIIRGELEKLVVNRRDDLTKKEDNELYKIYVNVIINELCEQELLQRFKEYCVYFGTFSDKEMTTKFFNTFWDVDNLPTETKKNLIAEYSSLELESDNLKK